MIDIPAAVLAVILLGALYVVHKAQEREDFDFADMLRDDNDKPSALRLGIFVCLAVSSWALIYDTIHQKELDPQAFGIYILVWSGAKIAEKIVDMVAAKWVGK